jgi:signal transduction histidine kinase/ActR/RegA family two-component response regulator
MFVAAQAAVARFFSDRNANPMQGNLEISGERYVLVRAASLSSEFFSLVSSLYADHGEEQARHVAEGLLFDLGHSIGVADANAFHDRMNLVDPVDKLAAGPIHFAYSGWAFVEILPESAPSPDQDYFLAYRHPHSFEADAWISQGRRATSPVCIMNAGYSSGWCEASFSLPLVAVEISCRGAGDEHCEFVMAPPDRIKAHLDRRRAARGEPLADQVPEFFARKRVADELHSAKLRLENMVAERTRELDAAVAELRREAERRERSESRLREVQKMDAVGTLAGGIAHDFNNLLTTIMSGIQLARLDESDDTPAAESLDLAMESARRAADLTRQLLAFGRRQEARTRSTDLNAVVRETAGFLRRSLPMAIDIEMILADQVGWIVADGGLLEQALINLAINARDAMPEGGRLRFETAIVDQEGFPSDEGDLVRIRVIDEGEGMPAEVIGRVFEPFFTTKDRGRGTGLGLAMVYSAASKHEGWVSVDSTPGRGSVFSIFLPWKPGEPSEDPRDHRRAVVGGDERILVVEDSAEVREQAARVLRRVGYRVDTATGADAALSALEGSQHALVLTDMIMPGGDGQALLRAIRGRGWTVPVVLMSGFLGEDSGDHRQIDPGFAGYLAKPFEAAEITGLIRDVLDAELD